MASNKVKLLAMFLCIFFCIAVSPVNASSYVYDDLNRLTSATLDTGETISYTYDAAGNILSVRSSSAPVASAALTPVLTDVLVNGDFETIASGQKVAPSWTADTSRGADAAYRVVSVPANTTIADTHSSITTSVYGNVYGRVQDNVYGGKQGTTQGQEVTLQGTAEAVAGVMQEIAAHSGTRYDISASIHPIQLNEAVAQLTVSFYGETGGLIGSSVLPVTGQVHSWHTIQSSIQAPEGTVKAQVTLQLQLLRSGGTGSAIFDNISFQQS